MIKPKKLEKGDLVGLVTTSHPVSREIIDKSARYLRSLGFKVRVSDHATDAYGFIAGKAEDRANDLMAMFRDKEVKAIFTNGGGRTANHLLPLLDFGEIHQHPKIFMGLSNPSIIANAITAKAGLITFHGPTGYNFGEVGITAFTERQMIKTIIDGEMIGKIEAYQETEVLRQSPNTAKGRLYGGHLLTTRALIGTPYAPNWRNVILFLEDCFEELHDFDDNFMHFKLAGILEKISGLVIGTPVEVEEKSYPSVESMKDIVKRICSDYDFPILYGLNIGHTDDKVTLPIGAVAEIDSQNGILEVNEAVVD
ncbi:MAG: S66 peptidase family protein [Candidatus Nealsonbacteria bacterium]